MASRGWWCLEKAVEGKRSQMWTAGSLLREESGEGCSLTANRAVDDISRGTESGQRVQYRWSLVLKWETRPDENITATSWRGN